MIVARHPDGRLLGAIVLDDQRCWLDLEASDPVAGVSTYHFITKGAAPPVTEFHLVPWEKPWSERPVVGYSLFIRPNIDLVRYLRHVEREERESYARIPARRRRHDRA
jgi:hypothetical protein